RKLDDHVSVGAPYWYSGDTVVWVQFDGEKLDDQMLKVQNYTKILKGDGKPVQIRMQVYRHVNFKLVPLKNPDGTTVKPDVNGKMPFKQLPEGVRGGVLRLIEITYD